ncbi:MAG TPA: hypothetical protein VGW33_07640 [Terriglobia bacterium]|nr:hypothetical protein [Terriglobia bacterium]
MPHQFDFRLLNGDATTPESWLNCWSSLYSQTYDEPVYNYLVKKTTNMTERDFQTLGAWKDGALKKSAYAKASEFDPNNVSFNGKWSPKAASVAYLTWGKAGKELSGQMTSDFPTNVGDFLRDWSERRDKCGTSDKRFGLARASTLLHFVSGGRYPIFDARVRRALKKLIGVTPDNNVDWYLNEFLGLFAALTKKCAADSDCRKVDKALFAYGGRK